MPVSIKSFKNSVTLLKDTEYVYNDKVYVVDTVIKASYYIPGEDHDGTVPTMQIMVDLAAMTDQLYKKYPDLEESVSFDASADTSMFPGTDGQGYALFPALTSLN